MVFPLAGFPLYKLTLPLVRKCLEIFQDSTVNADSKTVRMEIITNSV